jgi:hypothetical protein
VRPYRYIDGVAMKEGSAGEMRNVPVLLAIGMSTDEQGLPFGVHEVEKDDLERCCSLQRYMAMERLINSTRLDKEAVPLGPTNPDRSDRPVPPAAG